VGVLEESILGLLGSLGGARDSRRGSFGARRESRGREGSLV